MTDIKNLDLSRCESLRHLEVNFNSINRAFPDRPFHDFISTVTSPQLETCLVLSYDNDLEELEQLLLATPKSRDDSTRKEEKEKPKREVKITLGLDIEKEEAEAHRETIEAALGCAVGNGVFGFLTSVPGLEVYPRVWEPAM